MRTLAMLALTLALASCAGAPPATKAVTGPAAIPPALIPPGYVAADCHPVQVGKEGVEGSKETHFECTKQTVTNVSRPAGTAPSESETAAPAEQQERDPNGDPVADCHVTHDDDPNSANPSPAAHIRCTTRTEHSSRMIKKAKCHSPGGKELPPEEYCCSTPSGDPIPHCTPKPIPVDE
jgi:hypothetical protein